jgi:hypothetical protein
MSPVSYAKLKDEGQAETSMISKTKPIEEPPSPAVVPDDRVEVVEKDENLESVNLN